MFLTDLSEIDKRRSLERHVPRPKAYDPDEALSSAMQLFWNEGFEATSIPKLEKKIGINRFSIYDSFGSKRNLFLESLKKYNEMLVDELISPLENGTAGLMDIERFFENWTAIFMGGAAPRGCLLCNSAIELGNRDQEVAVKVRAYFERVEGAVLKCFMRAHEKGEITDDPTLMGSQARVARLCMEGVLMNIRLGTGPADVKRSLDALKSIFNPRR